MINRGNPLGIAATGQVTIDIEGAVKDLHERIKAAENDRANWIKKQGVLIEQRRGVRRPKTIPWVGANNDSIPLTDGIIRRWKPGIMSLVLDADPVAYFFATKPEDTEAARSAQDFYHWKFKGLPSITRKMHTLSDLLAQHGIAFTRQGWDYQVARRCRIINVNSIFPGGVEKAYEGTIAQITRMNEQIKAAQDAGQPLPPGVQSQPIPSKEEFIRQVLQQEYKLTEKDKEPDGSQTLEALINSILGGAEYLKLYYTIVEEDRPAFEVISALDVIVPLRNVPLEKQDFVGIVHRMSADSILKATRDGVFDKDKIQEVITHIETKSQRVSEVQMTGFDGVTGASRAQIGQALAKVEGTSTGPAQSKDEPAITPIWEIYCRLDVNGDGINEPVILWYHPYTSTVMSVIDYPMPFPEWPIVAFEMEYTSDRPYQSRGIAEMLSTYQRLVNQLHNARLDAIQVLLSPMFKMRAVNGELNRNIRFRPGMIIPVQDVKDLEPLIQDFRPLSQFLQEENYTKSLAEQYIGIFDQTLTQLGKAERRTATEVESINSQISQTFAQDASLFQESMAKVHRQLWSLWLDFGPDDEYYRVLGEDKPRMIKKCEINKKFDLFPAGTPANTNKALALARAREALQFFAPDQTGLINKHVLYKNYFDLTDRNFSKVVVRSEEEAAAVQAVLQAAERETGGEPAAY